MPAMSSQARTSKLNLQFLRSSSLRFFDFASYIVVILGCLRLGFSLSEIEHFSDIVMQAEISCDCRTDAMICSLLNRLGYVRSKSAVEARVSTRFLLIDYVYTILLWVLNN